MITSADPHAVALFAVLATLFFYLYWQHKMVQFLLWGLAWVVLMVRHTIAFLYQPPTLPWVVPDVFLLSLAGGLVFLGGLAIAAASQVGRRRAVLIGLVVGVLMVVVVAAVIEWLPAPGRPWATTLGAVGALWIAAGWMVDRFGRRRTPIGGPVAGLALVAWGALLPVGWIFAAQPIPPAWLPSMEIGLYVILAVGMIILGVEEARLVFAPRGMLDDDPNMIIVYQGEKYLFSNRTFEQLTGWSFRDLDRQEPFEYIAEEYREEAANRLRSLLDGEHSDTGFEVEIVRSNGEIVPVVIFGDLIAWEGRSAIKFELIDLTEQRRIEAEVRTMNAELTEINAELERTNALQSEFLSNTSHELKTPLTSIIANTEILEYEMCGAVNEEQRRILSSIGRNSQHLLEMISQLLDFARQEEGHTPVKYEQVDLAKLITSVVETVLPLEIGGVRFVVDVDDQLKPCYMDGEKIYRVYLNLVENAVKFSTEGEIRVSARLFDGELEGSVSDQGIGIPSEKLDEIFEAFRQVDASPTRAYQGVGLGLAITRQLVELHGGRIWAESEAGEGSVMRFRVPYLLQVPEQALEASAAHAR
jgi:PAS domain S-box-containing protein